MNERIRKVLSRLSPFVSGKATEALVDGLFAFLLTLEMGGALMSAPSWFSWYIAVQSGALLAFLLFKAWGPRRWTRRLYWSAA